MNVLDIVKKYIEENKLDGLFYPDEDCACTIDDLAPGSCLVTCMVEGCRPGRKVPCDCGVHNWHIEEVKPCSKS